MAARARRPCDTLIRVDSPFPAACAAKFQADGVLASGGFGTVYRATQLALGRTVVVKILHREVLSVESERQRFRDEARLTAALSHPNIVIVIDFGVDDDVPWIAYEYLPGRRLSNIASAGRIPWPDALLVGQQLASALAECHVRGIVHRDVKPANVIEVEPGRYKLIDFGIARESETTLRRTQPGMTIGSPAYLAPEVLAGDPAGPQADVYAAGILLVELLLGRTPPRRDDPTTLLADVSQLTPSTGTPPLPERLADVIARCLAARPTERYPHAGVLRSSLCAIRPARPARATLGGRVSATAAPPGQRARVLALGAGLVALIAVAGAAMRGGRPPAASVLPGGGAGPPVVTAKAAPPSMPASPAAALASLEPLAKAVARVRARMDARAQSWINAGMLASPFRMDSDLRSSLQMLEKATREVSMDLDQMNSVAEDLSRTHGSLRRCDVRALDLWCRAAATRYRAWGGLDHGTVQSARIRLRIDWEEGRGGGRIDWSRIRDHSDAPRGLRLLRAFHEAAVEVARRAVAVPAEGLALPAMLEDLRATTRFVADHDFPRRFRPEIEACDLELRAAMLRLAGPNAPAVGETALGFHHWGQHGSTGRQARARLERTRRRLKDLARVFADQAARFDALAAAIDSALSARAPAPATGGASPSR
jgi:serine/threonine-protein kinase